MFRIYKQAQIKTMVPHNDSWNVKGKGGANLCKKFDVQGGGGPDNVIVVWQEGRGSRKFRSFCVTSFMDDPYNIIMAYWTHNCEYYNATLSSLSLSRSYAIYLHDKFKNFSLLVKFSLIVWVFKPFRLLVWNLKDVFCQILFVTRIYWVICTYLKTTCTNHKKIFV